jgi:hypothetical protein
MEKQASLSPRSPQINIKLTEEEKVLFQKVGKARGLKISALARSLMHDEARRLGIS